MRRYRIWIARFGDWQPRRWHDLPPVGEAVEPAEERSFGREDAEDFVRGFNLAMLSSSGKFWAVAVPVSVMYEGDLTVGSRVVGSQLMRFAARARAPQR